MSTTYHTVSGAVDVADVAGRELTLHDAFELVERAGGWWHSTCRNGWLQVLLHRQLDLHPGPDVGHVLCCNPDEPAVLDPGRAAELATGLRDLLAAIRADPEEFARTATADFSAAAVAAALDPADAAPLAEVDDDLGNLIEPGIFFRFLRQQAAAADAAATAHRCLVTVWL
jgi:hypothetical protein